MKSGLLTLLCVFDLKAESPNEFTSCYEVTYDVFSLPIMQAAKLRRERPGGKTIYATLLAKVENKKARQEKWMALKTSPGKYANSEGFEEFVYPAEYVSDSFSATPQVLTNGMGIPMFHPRPFAVPWLSNVFDTKNVGDFLEVELSVENGLASMRLATTHIRHLSNDTIGKGVYAWRMPRFSVQQISTGVQTELGKPTLIGTLSPPKELQKEKQKRIWLAFVTIEKT